MNNVVKLKQPDDVLDQASEWIAKLDRGLSEHEQQAFKIWMQQPQHAEVLLEMAKLWDKLDVLSRLADVVQEADISQTLCQANDEKAHAEKTRNEKAHNESAQHASKQPSYKQLTPEYSASKPPAPVRFWAAAASILFVSLLAFSGGYFYNSDALTSSSNNALAMHQEVVQTQIGETVSRTLPDDSTLTLNTNSRVNVKFTSQQRILELQHGELHIDVAHNPARPLSVYAGGKIIQAVGTAFNVTFNQQQLALLVTEGTVRVAEQTPEAAAEVRLPASSVSLNKGEKSLLSAPETHIENVSKADMDAALSWQQGVLTFRGESLQQALAEMSRYSAVRFDIADDSLAQTQIVGVFNPKDVDALLMALQENINIHYEKRGPNHIVLKKKR